VPSTEVTDFEPLYAERCAGCHGVDGKLGPAPPLNDPVFLAIVPEAEVMRIIREGRSVTAAQKSPMPAFARDKGGPLTEAQIQALAQGLKKRWQASSSKDLPSYVAQEKGSWEKGRSIFARACAGCHGSQGQGDPKGDEPAGAINDPAFLALISDQALRRIIITGRSDLGMPGYDNFMGRPADFESLSSSDMDDLVALLAHWRRQSAP
jgi:cytochrome c oxidase cbb3-type subunit 3